MVRPVVITDAMLLASSLSEEFPGWNALTSYAAAERVVDPAGRSVWQSLQDGNEGNPPPTADGVKADDWWVRVSASNRWALFDRELNVPSLATGSMTLTVRPGPVAAIGLFGLSGVGVVQLTIARPASGVVWRLDVALHAVGINTQWAYFYGKRTYISEAAIVNVPAYADGELTMTFNGVGQIGVGEVAMGMPQTLGITEAGLGLSLKDYSVNKSDEFGRLTLKRRDYARTVRVPLVLPSNQVNRTFQLLRAVTSTPCMWIPDEARWLASSVLYGTFTRLSVDIPGRVLSNCTLELQGLAER